MYKNLKMHHIFGSYESEIRINTHWNHRITTVLCTYVHLTLILIGWPSKMLDLFHSLPFLSISLTLASAFSCSWSVPDSMLRHYVIRNFQNTFSLLRPRMVLEMFLYLLCLVGVLLLHCESLCVCVVLFCCVLFRFGGGFTCSLTSVEPNKLLKNSDVVIVNKHWIK